MNGILVLDKPAGCTSFDCVASVRRLTGEKKVGHTGTLDPQATGVLPLCIGKATRLLEYMDHAPKTYVCGCLLGTRTDTQDVWGTVLSQDDAAAKAVTHEAAEEALAGFLGEIEQRPPMYSAIKVKGRKLYEYARSGQTVDVPLRRVTIHDIRLLSWAEPYASFFFEVTCSRGTYIRSICEDLGNRLGCGACMSSLVRTQTCGYSLDRAVTLEALRGMDAKQIEALLVPMESAVAHLARIELDAGRARLFRNGDPLWSDGLALPQGVLAVFSDGALIGVVRDKRIAKVMAD